MQSIPPVVYVDEAIDFEGKGEPLGWERNVDCRKRRDAEGG